MQEKIMKDKLWYLYSVYLYIDLKFFRLFSFFFEIQQILDSFMWNFLVKW